LGPDFKGNFQSTFGRGFLEESWLKVVVELRLEVVVEFPLIHIAITVVFYFPEGPLFEMRSSGMRRRTILLKALVLGYFWAV
jgi:hypothetical protein